MTLGELADDGLTLRIWCNACGRSRERDALTLSLLLGRRRPIYGAWQALRCVECGASGKEPGRVYSMPGWRPVVGPGGREPSHAQPSLPG